MHRGCHAGFYNREHSLLLFDGEEQKMYQALFLITLKDQKEIAQ